MSRHTSATVISAYRATSIVDTPMRKLEVLEEQDGTVWLRETSFDNFRNAHVNLIHLEHHESQALAKVLITLEPEEDHPVELVRRMRAGVHANGNGDAA